MNRKTGVMVAALVAFSALVGLHKPVGAAVLNDPQPASFAAIDNGSWASMDPQVPTLFFDIRGQKVAGKARGYFGAGSSAWTLQGCLTGEADYIDQAGQHVQMTASVTFSHIVRRRLADAIVGTATFTSLQAPDGTTIEGIEVTDQAGNVLYSSGRDESGSLQMMPVIMGAVNVSH